MSHKLTQKEVREFVTSLDMSFQVRNGEFRIALRLPGNKTDEDSAYYTNDLDDAWCTAYAMREQANAIAARVLGVTVATSKPSMLQAALDYDRFVNDPG